MEKHSISKLIGAPPGYIGYEQGGRLTETIRRNPYSIILFDEIEKAHFDIFNILLQILDDGIITDSLGKTIDFKNTIIIMTSNICSKELLSENINKNIKQIIQKKIFKTFKPELLNRIDNVIIFNPLSKEVIKEIIAKELKELTKRIQLNRNITIIFSQKIYQKIIDEGYEREFGARPIKRYIQKHIETIIAKAIISDEIKEGENYVIDILNQQFVIQNNSKWN